MPVPVVGWPVPVPIVGSPGIVVGVAVKSSHLGLFAAVIALGFVLGIFGHIIRSRPLIVTGILIVGFASAYYVFVLQPGSG